LQGFMQKDKFPEWAVVRQLLKRANSKWLAESGVLTCKMLTT